MKVILDDIGFHAEVIGDDGKELGEISFSGSSSFYNFVQDVLSDTQYTTFTGISTRRTFTIPKIRQQIILDEL